MKIQIDVQLLGECACLHERGFTHEMLVNSIIRKPLGYKVRDLYCSFI